MLKVRKKLHMMECYVIAIWQYTVIRLDSIGFQFPEPAETTDFLPTGKKGLQYINNLFDFI